MATNWRYQDFELLFDSREPGYKAKVVSSPAGNGDVSFPSMPREEELRNLRHRLGTRRGVERLDRGTEIDTVKELGGKLFKTVFSGQVLACFRSSLVKIGERGGLRLRLRLDATPELAVLPWEYLYDSDLGRFLGESTRTPIIRYPELGEPPRALNVQPPIRVLAVVSDPVDLSRLDVEKELDQLHLGLEDLSNQGRVKLSVLSRPTRPALDDRLSNYQPHILHFMGHGEFDPKTAESGLFLEDKHGHGQRLESARLGTLVRDYPALRLAVLNTCEGARSSPADPFGGVAQTLVRQGIPAVVAMQFPISDRAAIVFARKFYRKLAEDGKVDTALAEARRELFLEQRNDVEWGSPVLHMRSTDGRIFRFRARRIAAHPSPPEPEDPSEQPGLPWRVVIQPGEERVLSTELVSSAAGGCGRMLLPFEPERLPNLIRMLEARSPAGSVDGELGKSSTGTVQPQRLTEPTSPRELGEALFTALFSNISTNGIEEELAQVKGGNCGLRLLLQIADNLKPVASLPWEYLYHGQFLGLHRGSSIVRLVPGATAASDPAACARPLRVLIVATRENLARATIGSLWTVPSWTTGNVELEVLPRASRQELRQALWRDHFDVLHFIGNGKIGKYAGRARLLLETDRGEPDEVGEDVLLNIAGGFPHRPRFVFLEPIEPPTSKVNPLIELAGAFVKGGFDAAITLHFPISRPAMAELLRILYSRFARGIPPPAALAEGRLAVDSLCPNTAEWGSPVLFMGDSAAN